MATEVGKWDFRLNGMTMGTEGSESADGKMKFLTYAKRDASGAFITGQATSCWISSIEKVSITAAGEYVVKVSHNDPGNANTAFGDFSFVPDFATNIPSAKASIANVTFANNTLTAASGESVVGTLKIYNLSGSVVFEKAITTSSVSENTNLAKVVYLCNILIHLIYCLPILNKRAYFFLYSNQLKVAFVLAGFPFAEPYMPT